MSDSFFLLLLSFYYITLRTIIIWLNINLLNNKQNKLFFNFVTYRIRFYFVIWKYSMFLFKFLLTFCFCNGPIFCKLTPNIINSYILFIKLNFLVFKLKKWLTHSEFCYKKSFGYMMSGWCPKELVKRLKSHF